MKVKVSRCLSVRAKTRVSSTPFLHSVVVEEASDDPPRWLVLGPDRAGNLLELVVLDRPQGPAVIHATRVRPKYQRLLPKGR